MSAGLFAFTPSIHDLRTIMTNAPTTIDGTNDIEAPDASTATPDESNASPVRATLSLWLLRAGTAKKVSKYGDGSITYQVLADADRAAIYIAITGNNGGGYFSRERVSFDAIEACLNRCDASKPFPSKTFKPAFVGRSSNNSGFLVAVLRAEDLLCQAQEVAAKHEVAADWAAWKNAVLAEPGTLIEVDGGEASPSPAQPAPIPEHTEHKQTLKLPGKKKA